ncbi:hypothetical protein HII36_53165 [Nonomuraea sp. NN258]|uniref:hypothetical protein n=1 Tax=Nonomuraea antri TaxID=2730852 RepID=UPI00156A1BDF|nr:hypothetical protein [Nonomuraea antri]NRQ40511.1 hypothetical protein [Nonomuraea antri]
MAPELDEQGRRIFEGLHRLLLRLAGRFPDDLVFRTRTMLAGGDLTYLPDIVTAAAAELGVTLTAPELDLLREVPVALGVGGEPTGAGQVTVSADTPPTGHFFRRDDETDLSDDLVTDALTEYAGVAGVWRAWRSDPDRRVYLAEVAPGVPAWELTAVAQTELVQMDDDAPQVEVFWTGDDLTPYHRAALDHATPLYPA